MKNLKKGYCEFCGFKLNVDGDCPNPRCRMFKYEDYLHEANE
jgi:hypothetical protein